MKVSGVMLFFVLLCSCSKKMNVDKYEDPASMSATYISSVEMKEDVEYLASDALEGREAGTKGEKLAAAYIKKRMTSEGIKPGFKKRYYQDFDRRIRANIHATEDSADDTILNIRNVIGMVDNGRKGSIVIGAHYDHLGHGGEGSLFTEGSAIHNGADDNASGVSIMLELAQKLNANKLREKHNIIIIAFSGEEKGLWGSNYYAKNNDLNMKDISFMINMDMVGRLNPERKLAINGVGTSPVFTEYLEKTNNGKFHLITSESGIGPSDHTSFYLEDVPVLHFFTGQHEDYHKPSDDFEKLNYEGMKDISGYLYSLILQLDEVEDLEFNKTKDESQETPSFKVTLGVIPDYLYDGQGMRIDGVKEGRPASNAGIIKGDIVKMMGDLKIIDMMGYMKGLASFNKGQTVQVTILRDGKEIEKSVTF